MRVRSSRWWTIVPAAAAAVLVAPAAPALAGSPQPVCGQVLTTDTKLLADLTCAGDGLVIGAPNITLNLGDHKLTGNGTGNGISWSPVNGGATIKNGTVAGFGYGIKGTGGSATISKLTMPNNSIRLIASLGVSITHATFPGLFGTDVSGLTVMHSTVNGSLGFQSLSDATFSHNKFVNGGVNLSETSHVSIVDNTFTNGGVGFGVVDHTLVQHNHFKGGGITISYDAEQTQVLDNVIEDAQFGVWIGTDALDIEAGTVISGNAIRDNRVAGLLYEVTTKSGCVECPQIVNNTFTRNGFAAAGYKDRQGNPVADGLHIDTPTGTPVVVANNKTSHNASYGIYAVGGTQDGGGNNSRANPNGCLGVVCS